jgi:hypothetical protein
MFQGIILLYKTGLKWNKSLLLAGAVLFAGCPLLAQSIGPSTIDAAGNSYTAAGTTYEYAIGQLIAANTFTSPALVITHGVLQPSSASGIAGNMIPAESLQVYPSPVENSLFLRPAFSAGGTLKYGLYDAAGKLIMSHERLLKNGSEPQELSVGHIAAGQYLLNVSWHQGDKTYISAYKLQKLQ